MMLQILFIWLRTGTSGGLLRTHKTWEISSPFERLLASQKGLCSMELVKLSQSLGTVLLLASRSAYSGLFVRS
jgi:hypothetical protein